MKQYIGIDLGGTGIKGAVVREDGEILARQTCPTRPQRGPAAVAEDIGAMIRTLGRGREVAGVGLGCPGTVDDRAGTVVYACNIGWVNYDVRRALEDTGFSVRLVNDANAAALAEAAVGAAKGARSAVVVTLGTGIGGAWCWTGTCSRALPGRPASWDICALWPTGRAAPVAAGAAGRPMPPPRH